MFRFVAFALTLVVGIAAGLAATYATLRAPPPFGAVRSGSWTAWPEAGTPAADPFARAIFAQNGTLPLPASTGLRFYATLDDAGGALEGRCDYVIAGPVPAAQFWTLSTFDPDGHVPSGPDMRTGFTSAELIRDEDGGFAIALARQARPGNWLPLRGSGPFTLMLSLYDSPLGVSLQSGGPPPTLPGIARGDCR